MGGYRSYHPEFNTVSFYIEGDSNAWERNLKQESALMTGT